MENILKELTDMRGISGFEYRISDKIINMFSPYCDEIKKDNLGNIIALKKGRTSKSKIMIEAHMDEIGLMVSEIDKKGFIKFVNIGGVDERTLPSCEVTIHGTKDIKGVIGAKPPHLQESGEDKNSIKVTDMSIDTGLDAEKVKRIVSVGDSITLADSVGKLLNNIYSAKTLDDRAGVCCLLQVFKNIQELDSDLYAAISVQEEVGLRGALASAFSIQPDFAVAIDVCHAVTPDNSKNAFELGSGAVITVGPNIHPKISDKLFEIADKFNIKTETDVDSGNTGTDAWAIQTAGFGVPVGLLSIPLKYMHTSVETVCLSDIEATALLLEKFIKESDNFAEDWLCY